MSEHFSPSILHLFEIQPLHEATCLFHRDKLQRQISQKSDFLLQTLIALQLMIKSSSAIQFILKSMICRHKML